MPGNKGGKVGVLSDLFVDQVGNCSLCAVRKGGPVPLVYGEVELRCLKQVNLADPGARRRNDMIEDLHEMAGKVRDGLRMVQPGSIG